jgi:uncharacterized delta-60 repeat protein
MSRRPASVLDTQLRVPGRGLLSRALRAVCYLVLVVVLAAWQVPPPGLSGPRAGTLDPTFGTDGKVTTDFAGTSDVANALVVQTDGKLVAAGRAETTPTSHDFGLARYRPGGALDGTFGTGGRVSTDVRGEQGPDEAHALVVQPDGKLVAAGAAFNSGGTDGQFALVRYNADGTLDTTFGTGGKVTTDFRDHDVATALAVQPDGKLVAAGYTTTVFQTPWDFALARYNPDGRLDPTFGVSGRVTTDFARWTRPGERPGPERRRDISGRGVDTAAGPGSRLRPSPLPAGWRPRSGLRHRRTCDDRCHRWARPSECRGVARRRDAGGCRVRGDGAPGRVRLRLRLRAGWLPLRRQP